ncbi:MAG TPA: antibiotic biosynthesis monooxygenase [Steroidobacteraceae bacterium]|nr:antibiotic biosynthesis monooxygenase [Steroidobacteraceae bacterium]
MSDAKLATTPQPPYYAVIFSSVRTAQDDQGYAAAADRMVQLASEQPGYLGVDSVRDATGVGITVSYWSSEAAISAWRRHAEHTIVREQGRKSWYVEYELRVAKVERAYGFKR